MVLSAKAVIAFMVIAVQRQHIAGTTTATTGKHAQAVRRIAAVVKNPTAHPALMVRNVRAVIASMALVDPRRIIAEMIIAIRGKHAQAVQPTAAVVT